MWAEQPQSLLLASRGGWWSLCALDQVHACRQDSAVSWACVLLHHLPEVWPDADAPRIMFSGTHGWLRMPDARGLLLSLVHWGKSTLTECFYYLFFICNLKSLPPQ